MAKDSYYFPHDYNARNDRKIASLVKKHRAAGYGVFWITCEMMHEENGTIEFDEITFGAIAKDSNEEVEFVKNVITDCITEFKLFRREDDIVLSGRVSRNLDKRQEVSKSRAIAGKLGANAKQMLANGEQNEAKERKERKEKKEIRGIDFSPEKLKVIFPDGSSQELGQNQLRRSKEGNFQPHYIIKGLIE